MTLFSLFPGKCYQRFPRLTRACLLFFICFIKQACGGPNAASLLSRRG